MIIEMASPFDLKARSPHLSRIQLLENRLEFMQNHAKLASLRFRTKHVYLSFDIKGDSSCELKMLRVNIEIHE